VFEQGRKVRVRVSSRLDVALGLLAIPGPGEGRWTLFLVERGSMHEVSVSAGSKGTVWRAADAGGSDAGRVFAGMWTRGMATTVTNAESSAIASTQRLRISTATSVTTGCSP
jgi:hypothetical protein